MRRDDLLSFVRTTFDFNDELLRAAQGRAAKDGVTLREIIEAALRAYLVNADGAHRRYAFKWTPTMGACGPPAWHRDGARIACVRDGALHVVDARAGTSSVVAAAATDDDRVAFTPDGRAIAYSRAPS